VADSALLRAIDRHVSRRRRALAAAAVVTFVTMVTAVCLGSGPLSGTRVITLTLAPLFSHIPAPTEAELAILRHLRLPRVMLGALAGAALAVAGVAMQGITRNPLVSAYTLGISPAAAFGASLAILSGAAGHASWGRAALVGGAFVGAITCAGAVLAFAALRRLTATQLVLTGIGLTYLFSALTASVQFVATEQQLSAMVQWTFGSLNGATWDEVAVTAIIVTATLATLARHAWALNAFAGGGDDVATSLGFAAGRTRAIITVAAALATAVVVSFTGVIAFVGLVAPHIGRLLVGGDHRILIPFAALAGATLIVGADLAGRVLLAPVLIPVGIVVAYVGVPVFLHLLLTRRQEGDA